MLHPPKGHQVQHLVFKHGLCTVHGMIPLSYVLQAFNRIWLIHFLTILHFQCVIMSLFSTCPVVLYVLAEWTTKMLHGVQNLGLSLPYTLDHILLHFVLDSFPKNTLHSISPWALSWSSPRLSTVTQLLLAKYELSNCINFRVHNKHISSEICFGVSS